MSGNKFKIGQMVNHVIDRIRGVETSFNPHGFFDVELWRDGELIFEERVPNGVTTVGINDNFDVAFRNQTQHASWYIGLIDNSGYSDVNAADTHASHSGWVEFTNYTGTNRIAWVPSAAASGSITNGSTSDFAISGSGTLKGIYITNDQAHATTSGILWATALFSANVTVAASDTLKITYTINGS
jgi:hypothetical protein